MISVMASLFLVALDQTIIATALGKIVEEFNAFDSLSWIITSYLLTTTVTVPIAGKLSDLFGRRRILLIGVAIFTLGSLLSGMSGDVLQLILARAFQGIGGGIITANAFTIIGDLFAARERGKWQGMIGAVFGLSSVIGPLLGGWLTDGQNIFGLITDWRWTLLINVPVGVIAFTLIAIYSPALKHAKKPRVDYLGASLLAVALATLILAVDNTENIFKSIIDGGVSLLAVRSVLFGIVALAIAAFIYVERRAKEPVLPLKFFKNANFFKITVISTFFGAAFLGAILYLTQFNQQVFSASPTMSGLMLLPLVGGIVISAVGAGALISKTGRYKAFLQVGFSVATITMFSLVTLTPESTYLQEAIIMAIMGLGMGVAMPVLNIAVQNEFEQKDLGVATSSSQLFRSLGSTIGTAIFGAILTGGIIAQLGSIQDTAYIKSLSSQPEVSKIGSLEDGNTILTINSPDIEKKITDAASAEFAKLPAPIATKASEQFKESQDEFSGQVVQAFSDNLHKIFLIAGSLILVATVIVFTIKEKELASASPLETPGEM